MMMNTMADEDKNGDDQHCNFDDDNTRKVIKFNRNIHNNCHFHSI